MSAKLAALASVEAAIHDAERARAEAREAAEKARAEALESATQAASMELAGLLSAAAAEAARGAEEAAFAQGVLAPALGRASSVVASLRGEWSSVSEEFEEGRDLALLQERTGALRARLEGCEEKISQERAGEAAGGEARSASQAKLAAAWASVRRSGLDCAAELECVEEFLGAEEKEEVGGGSDGGRGGLAAQEEKEEEEEIAALAAVTRGSEFLRSTLEALAATEAQCKGSSSTQWLKGALKTARSGGSSLQQRERIAQERALDSEEAALEPLAARLPPLRSLVASLRQQAGELSVVVDAARHKVSCTLDELQATTRELKELSVKCRSP